MTPGFVGRDEELAELLAGAEGALEGRGSLFFVSGEVGIGKTVLADHFAQLAQKHGFGVLWGRSWQGGGAPSFLPWSQVVLALAEARGAERLRSYAGRHTDEVRALVPELWPAEGTAEARATRLAESDASRQSLFAAVSRLLCGAAEHRPLLLVLEDLHEADPPSLLLLRYLARELRRSRLLVLATYREPEGARSTDLLGLLADVAAEATLLRLEPLTEEQIGELVSGLAGVVPETSKLRAIKEATQGNPLFIREVLRLVGDREQLDAPGRLTLSIPDSVRALIGQRLGPLTAQADQLLSVAAVAGVEFDLPLLKAACDLPAERVLLALEEAVDEGVLAESDRHALRYRFSHPLMREVIYDQLPVSVRARLHQRLGELVEKTHGPGSTGQLALLAHHFGHVSGAEDKAMSYARDAGDQAMLNHGYEDAVSAYRSALDLMDASAAVNTIDRCELHLRLGDAQARAGKYLSAKRDYRTAVDLARTVGASKQLARGVLGLGEPQVEGGRFDSELIALLQEALDLHVEADAVRARLLARLSIEHTFSDRPHLRGELSLEALALARQVNDLPALGTALRARWLALWGPDASEEAGSAVQEMLDLARRSADRELELLALARQAACALDQGRIALVHADVEAHARLAAELRMPAHQWNAATMSTMLALLNGALGDAEPLLEEALAFQPERPTAQYVATYTRVQLDWERGRLGDRCTELHELLTRLPRFGITRPWLALAHVERGESLAAQGALRPVLEQIDELPRDLAWLPTLTLAATAAARSADHDAAERLQLVLRPHAGRVAFLAAPQPVACLGSVALSLGQTSTLLGRFQEAEEHFVDALRVHHRLGAPTLLARTQREYARMLLQRGFASDRGTATDLLAASRTTAEALGMAGLLAEIDRVEVPADKRADHLTSHLPVRRSKAAGSGFVLDHVFRRDGEFWTIRYGGPDAHLRDSKGLGYLARLLTSPGREMLALDLESAANRSGTGVDDSVVEGLEIRRGLGDAGALLDDRAKSAYRNRLAELDAEIEEAADLNDPDRAVKAREEKDFLLAELARAVGLDGRDRRAASHAERARLNVTRAIRSAMRHIAEADPALGEHLASTIRTGRYCSYTPDPRTPIHWDT